MKPDAADNSVPREISSLLSKERVILRETQRAVTPLGGVAVFVAFLHQLGLVEKLRQHMPMGSCTRNSPTEKLSSNAFWGRSARAASSWCGNCCAKAATVGAASYWTCPAIPFASSSPSAAMPQKKSGATTTGERRGTKSEERKATSEERKARVTPTPARGSLTSPSVQPAIRLGPQP